MAVTNHNCTELEKSELTKYNTLSPEQYTILKVDSSLSYSNYFENFLFNNIPCILKDAEISTWRSVKEWISEGFIQFQYLEGKYGNAKVPVADCTERYYNVQKKSTIPFAEYLHYWRKFIDNNHCGSLPCLYLKDWHFTKDFPCDNIYRVPKYFASDWLNEYLNAKTDDVDDYRFVYMGPKGSWTPLHVDVFTSFSWSVNICGRKRWLLFPPGQEKYLCDKFGNLAYDATDKGMEDKSKYPFYQDIKASYDIIQESGEAIFVPSGWHHQVWNLEDCISVNHNWINGCNIASMWHSLKRNLAEVKGEIEDCKNMDSWEEHCQIMLRSVFGINYEEFYKFLLYIAKKRWESFYNNQPVNMYGNWNLGKQHTLFDLKQLRHVLNDFLSDADTQILEFYKSSTESKELIEEIDKALQMNENPS